MILEKIQELGHAAASLRSIAFALTDENLKDKLLYQAGVVADAHDELLTQHKTAMAMEAGEGSSC